MTKIPTPAEIKSFHEEVFTKLMLNDMLAAADPDGAPVSMPLGKRSSEIVRYILANNLEPAVVAPLTPAQVDRLLEVVKLIFDLRSTAMATPEELQEIYSSVRTMLDEVLSVTEAKVVDLVRMFDAACQRRIDEIDDVIRKVQQRCNDRGRSLN